MNPNTIQPGENIGETYKIDKVLGEGAFGIVKKAIKKRTGEEYAIKIMDKNKLSDDDLMSLETEVDMLLQIDHPNVVKLEEIYEDSNNFYMVLELMTGGELFERIVEKDHYSEKEAADTIRPLIDGLRYCHKMGIVHRDLKPENLLYSSTARDATIKISDFGLARYYQGNELMTTQCGTPGYVAPEIVEGRGYTEAIDYWSIGVILYIMLCGFPPFYEENDEKLFELIRNCKYEFQSPFWDDISPIAKDLIRKILVADPKRRLRGDQIMDHEWMKTNTFNKNLPNVAGKIKEYSVARRKLQKGMNLIRAATLWRSATKNK